MSAEQPTIIYTLTDEAPLLATYAFLPVIRTFAEAAGIDVQTSDISVAARILAEFGDYLTEEVLNRHSERVRDFIVTASILDRFSAPLCDHVAGISDSASSHADGGKPTRNRSHAHDPAKETP